MLQTALRAVFPDECLLCREPVESPGALCGPCWRDTPFILGLVCDLCGTPLLGEDPGGAVHCDDCRSAEPAWQRGRSVMLYRGGARRLALALKHGDRLDLAPAVGGWMAERAAPLVLPGMLVAPVPLHWRRLFRRRYNQAAVLGREVARRLALQPCADLLQRRRATAPLGRMSPDERAGNLEGAIVVAERRHAVLAGRPVLLVDDVMTTGATLQACASALKIAGSGEVHVLTLARTARDT